MIIKLLSLTCFLGFLRHEEAKRRVSTKKVFCSNARRLLTHLCCQTGVFCLVFHVAVFSLLFASSLRCHLVVGGF